MDNDLISRQAAIDAILAIKDYGNSDRANALGLAECAVTTLPSAQPEQRWIPVTEALPEEPFGCLVTVMDTEPMTCEDFENILPYFVGYDGEQWNDWEGEQCPFEVLAWMPLPEPWRGGQDEDDRR